MFFSLNRVYFKNPTMVCYGEREILPGAKSPSPHSFVHTPIGKESGEGGRRI